MFVSNYTALKQQRFSFIGLYQYLRKDQDVASQAAAFCNWVGPLSALFPGSIPILDLEEGSGDQSGRANQWLNIVDTFYGFDTLPLNRRSWLYSYTSFVLTHNLGGIFASNRHTWIAEYDSTEPSLGHTIWQSTDGTNGSHIVNWSGCGRCDSSITSHSLSELASMAYQPQDTPPVDPPAQAGEDMPSGHVESGVRQTEGWAANSVKQIVLHSDWQGVQDQPPQVRLRIMHMNTQPFDAGVRTVDETDVYVIDSPSDNNGCSFFRVDNGAATVAWHTN
jgi:hypothetical protein